LLFPDVSASRSDPSGKHQETLWASAETVEKSELKAESSFATKEPSNEPLKFEDYSQ